MDARELAEQFRGRLVFWGGGVNTQSTLPGGTPQEVARQAVERRSIFGGSGGFVFSAIHNIQARTPAENLAAMLDAVHAQG